MGSKKTGCPGCGKPTSGTPTDKGFQWALCDDCLAKAEAERKDSVAPGEDKPPKDSPNK